MGQSADQLREEINAKREEASVKIEQIEEKVGAATQQVKDKFDWRRQVDDNPLFALGAATFAGMILGGLVSGGDDDRQSHRDTPNYERYGTSPYPQYRSYNQGNGGGIGASLRSAAKSSGLEETISSMGGTLMATLADRVREVADQSIPGLKEKLSGGPSHNNQSSSFPGSTGLMSGQSQERSRAGMSASISD